MDLFFLAHAPFILFYIILLFFKNKLNSKIPICFFVLLSYIISGLSIQVGGLFFLFQLVVLLLVTPVIAWKAFFNIDTEPVKSFFLTVSILLLAEFVYLIGFVLYAVSQIHFPWG